jgi:hypothetical protein
MIETKTTNKLNKAQEVASNKKGEINLNPDPNLALERENNLSMRMCSHPALKNSKCLKLKHLPREIRNQLTKRKTMSKSQA